MCSSRAAWRVGWTSLLIGSCLGLQQPPAPDAPASTPEGNPPAIAPERPAGREESAPRERQRRRAQVPENVELVRDVVYATVEGADGQPIELTMDTAFLKQSDGSPMPVVVYIHGGGWSGGSKSAGLPFVVAFAQGGYFAATIEYRLSNTEPFPNAIHDCKASIRFLRAHAADLGIDANRIGVWGHSAGGHLSAMLGACGNEKTQEGSVGETGVHSAVSCVATVSGPSDLVLLRQEDVPEAPDVSPDGERAARAGLRSGPLSGDAGTLKQASPVHYVDVGDPPFLIVHGSADELVPIEQAQLLLKAIQSVNGKAELLTIEGAGHAIGQPDAIASIARFFDDQLGGSAEPHMATAAERQQRMRGEGGRRRGPRGSEPGAPPPPPGSPPSPDI